MWASKEEYKSLESFAYFLLLCVKMVVERAAIPDVQTIDCN